MCALPIPPGRRAWVWPHLLRVWIFVVWFVCRQCGAEMGSKSRALYSHCFRIHLVTRDKLGIDSNQILPFNIRSDIFIKYILLPSSKRVDGVWARRQKTAWQKTQKNPHHPDKKRVSDGYSPFGGISQSHFSSPDPVSFLFPAPSLCHILSISLCMKSFPGFW